MRSSDLAAAGHVAVYGFGREGRAVVAHLARHAPTTAVTVLLDDPPDTETVDAIARTGAGLVVGEARVTDALLGDVGIVLRSPGVPVHHGPIARARDRQPELRVTTSNSLWFGDHAPARLVAVTGTKGKSTSSALLAHLLRHAGMDVALAGNIGRPLIELGPPDPHDVVVVELSSYQLADLEADLPVGVWLNVHGEHLPWHGSHARYVADKGRIAQLSRTLVANAGDAEVVEAVTGHADVRWFDARTDPVHVGTVDLPRTVLEDALATSRLVGTHHVANLAAMLAAAAELGVPSDRLLDGLATFEPLPHRLQLVHDDGRRWVDDSIATIPEAAVAALAAFPDRPVTLLAGGTDRGQDHAPLVAALGARDDVLVVALPDTGTRLCHDLARTSTPTVEVADLAEAIAVADARTPRGGVVLLSPAAPSFVQFTSYEDRGQQFAALAATVG